MAIAENLRKIQEARYGREVRGAIHDAIHECYEDGRAGTTDLIAREQITAERIARETAVAGAMSAITAEQAARTAAVTAEQTARETAVAGAISAITAEQAAREAAVANLESIKADKTQLASPFNFKGSCLFAELPTSGNEVNDTYYVTDMTSRYSWNGTAWYQSGMSEADYTDALAAVGTAVQNLEDGAPGTITSEIKEEIKYVVDGLSEDEYIANLAWERGYISGSDGQEGMNNINVRSKIISLKVGDLVSLYTKVGNFIFHEYVNGSWNRMLGGATGTVNAGYAVFAKSVDGLQVLEITRDFDARAVVNLVGNVPIDDESQGDDVLSIQKKHGYKRIDDLEKAVAKDNGDIKSISDLLKYGFTEVKLSWHIGYISGSDGSLHPFDENVNLFTDEFSVQSGDVLTNTWNGNMLVYSYNDDGTFAGRMTYVKNDKYVFEQAYSRLRISFEYGIRTSDTSIGNQYGRLTTTGTFDTLSSLIKTNNNNSFWNGKKIVWFGTSIPAGVSAAGASNGGGSYPVQIGDKLGATVYNESVGSSGVRSGNHNAISSSDPMGYSGLYATSLMLSLSLSSAEKEAIFDEWDSKWKSIIPAANQVDTSNKQRYYDTSWDVKLAKYLNGGSVGRCDLYVFDHGHNDAIVGYDYSELKTVPPSGHESDRTYFIGAMRFIIEKILTDNPKARICFIGHYENDRKTGISEAQELLANIWKYPLFKTWEHIGWSQNKVTVNGVQKTITQIWMPDDLHPSSDTTGEALKHYANVLYPFMRDVR